MLIDYYLASQIGRAWLWAHRSLRATKGDGPGLCMAVARHEPVPALLLWRAQDFAREAWFRAGMTSLLAAGATAFLASLLPRGAARDSAFAVPLIVGGLMFAAMVQMILAGYRAYATMRHIIHRGPEAASAPLTPFDAGYPTRYDFWAMSFLAIIVWAILAYAGTRSSH